MKKSLQKTAISAGLFCLAVFLGGAMVVAEPARPNFVFFLVDDLGWADVGAYGSRFHETPHIDALAASGMRFTNGYAACPVCSPTRASILTGRHPVRVNITDWIPGARASSQWNPRFLQVNDADFLDLKEVTIAEALKSQNYQTFFAGKWHLGGQGHLPTDQGFDVNIGGFQVGSPPGGYYSPWRNPYLKSKKEGEYLTERLTDESIHFLESRKKNQPFLLYLSYYNVHTPIQAYRKRVERFEKKKAKLFQDPTPSRDEHQGHSRLRQDNPSYASMVAAVDDSVGRVLAALERLGLSRNTVVIFFSDNGGLCTTGGMGPTCNLPLRSGKGWLYEGGIREPMIIRAPGVTRPGSVCDVPAVSMDFFPTMLELAGLPPMPEAHADGASLVPLLRESGTLPPRALYWHYPHYHGSTWRPGAAIRDGDWKLIEFYEYGKTELYNLAADLGETRDLSQEKPEKLKELQEKLHAWQKKMGAQMPRPNPEYDPALPLKPPKGWNRNRRRKVKVKPAVPKIKGARITASSFERVNPPGNAFDGDKRTRWAGNGPSTPQWWMVELPEPRKVDQVTIHWKNRTWFKYVVEVSRDGKEWQTVADERQSEAPRVVSQHQVGQVVRFLRVRVESLGRGWVSFTEIDL